MAGNQPAGNETTTNDLPPTIALDVTPAHVELGVDTHQREIGPLWLALEEAGYEVLVLLATEARLRQGNETAWYRLDENAYQMMAAGFRNLPIQPSRVTLTRRLVSLNVD